MSDQAQMLRQMLVEQTADIPQISQLNKRVKTTIFTIISQDSELTIKLGARLQQLGQNTLIINASQSMDLEQMKSSEVDVVVSETLSNINEQTPQTLYVVDERVLCEEPLNERLCTFDMILIQVMPSATKMTLQSIAVAHAVMIDVTNHKILTPSFVELLRTTLDYELKKEFSFIIGKQTQKASLKRLVHSLKPEDEIKLGFSVLNDLKLSNNEASQQMEEVQFLNHLANQLIRIAFIIKPVPSVFTRIRTIFC